MQESIVHQSPHHGQPQPTNSLIIESIWAVTICRTWYKYFLVHYIAAHALQLLVIWCYGMHPQCLSGIALSVL
jgi:hypothetical protein